MPGSAAPLAQTPIETEPAAIRHPSRLHGGRRVLFINPEDAAARGWAAGQRVDITSHFGDEPRVARSFQLVPFAIPRRCLAAYFPEANVLVPVGSVAEESNTPTSKSIHVSLSLSAEREGGLRI
jgi:anaerobic selenocysteine-containing dehydrogenase